MNAPLFEEEKEPSQELLRNHLTQVKFSKCIVHEKMYLRVKHLEEHMLSARNDIQMLNMNTQSNVAAFKTKNTPKRNLIQQTLHKYNKRGRICNTRDVLLKHMETLLKRKEQEII